MVVVVVANEVFDEVVWEELLELTVELRGQCLVVTQDKGWPLCLLNDIGDRKRLSRSCDAQKCLMGQSGVQPFDQLPDGFRLVTLGLEFAVKFKSGHGATARHKKRGQSPLFYQKSPFGA